MSANSNAAIYIVRVHLSPKSKASTSAPNRSHRCVLGNAQSVDKSHVSKSQYSRMIPRLLQRSGWRGRYFIRDEIQQVQRYSKPSSSELKSANLTPPYSTSEGYIGLNVLHSHYQLKFGGRDGSHSPIIEFPAMLGKHKQTLLQRILRDGHMV